MTSYQMTLNKLHAHFDALEPEPMREEETRPYVMEEIKEEPASFPQDAPKRTESARIG
jgi:hypothetical protein